MKVGTVREALKYYDEHKGVMRRRIGDEPHVRALGEFAKMLESMDADNDIPPHELPTLIEIVLEKLSDKGQASSEAFAKILNAYGGAQPLVTLRNLGGLNTQNLLLLEAHGIHGDSGKLVAWLAKATNKQIVFPLAYQTICETLEEPAQFTNVFAHFVNGMQNPGLKAITELQWEVLQHLHRAGIKVDTVIHKLPKEIPTLLLTKSFLDIHWNEVPVFTELLPMFWALENKASFLKYLNAIGPTITYFQFLVAYANQLPDADESQLPGILQTLKSYDTISLLDVISKLLAYTPAELEDLRAGLQIANGLPQASRFVPALIQSKPGEAEPLARAYAEAVTCMTAAGIADTTCLILLNVGIAASDERLALPYLMKSLGEKSLLDAQNVERICSEAGRASQMAGHVDSLGGEISQETLNAIIDGTYVATAAEPSSEAGSSGTTSPETASSETASSETVSSGIPSSEAAASEATSPVAETPDPGSELPAERADSPILGGSARPGLFSPPTSPRHADTSGENVPVPPTSGTTITTASM